MSESKEFGFGSIGLVRFDFIASKKKYLFAGEIREWQPKKV